MNKYAELEREATVRGILAALNDTGILKFASLDEYSDTSKQVAGMFGDEEVTFEKVAELIDDSGMYGDV